MTQSTARTPNGPTRRHTLALLAGLTAAPSIAAAGGASGYALDTAATRVGFTYMLDGTPLTAAMPITHAYVALDPANLASARIDVTMDASASKLGLNFADAALARPDMLHTTRHPSVRFVSTAIHTGIDGLADDEALVHGTLTMRGQSRPVVLKAAIDRHASPDAQAPERATIRLTGNISRRAFGATGYPGLVGDRIGLDVEAPIHRV